MRILRTSIGACAIALGTVGLAQNEEDALRYSTITPGGTARTWALAGAFGAVGADPAAATINPAGFGLYNASEITMTLGFEVNDATATYYGTKAAAGQQRMSVNNMALVLNYPKPGSDWRGGTFGVSYDRQASYHWKELARGERVNSTILQRFVNEAHGTDYTELEGGAFPFTSGLAWYAYGIDTIPGSDSLYAPGIPFGSDTRQEHSIDASGRVNSTNIFYANNYMDRLYVGIALGIIGTRYERYTRHAETSLSEAGDLESVIYKEDLLTTGNGIDVKMGLIGRVSDRVRLGAAFHSPMWLLLNDSYSYSMITAYRGGGGESVDSDPGTFSYRVNTPWRVVLSGVYQAGKHGLVSVDYTYADYRSSKLRASREFRDTYDYAVENDLIKNSFVGTHSLRVGTEWRSGRWYFRGGWAFQPDPYTDQDARHGTAYKRYSGGIGVRDTHWSLDLTGVYGMRDGKYFQYTPQLVQPTTAAYTDFRTFLTFTLRP
jgi:hypothetical protein